MKYFILTLLLLSVLTVGRIFFLTQSASPQLLELQRPVEMKTNPVASVAPQNAPVMELSAQLQTELQQLNHKLQNIDHELEQVGYPKVMLDERLTESERNQIIDKLLAASQLQERISLLTLKKINLQAEL